MARSEIKVEENKKSNTTKRFRRGGWKKSFLFNMVLRNHGCVKIAYVYAATSLWDEMTKRCTAYISTIWLPWITLLFLSDFVSWKVGRVSFASLTLQPFSKKYTGAVKLKQKREGTLQSNFFMARSASFRRGLSFHMVSKPSWRFYPASSSASRTKERGELYAHTYWALSVIARWVHALIATAIPHYYFESTRTSIPFTIDVL